MSIVPVDALVAPIAEALPPPVTVPVIEMVPAAALLAPVKFVLLPAPPITVPVIEIIPVELLCAPLVPDAPEPVVPPNTFPFIFSVPVEVLFTPWQFAPVPAVTFPTIDAELPEVPEKVTQVEVPAMQFAVSVTPLESVNPPPAVALLALSVRTSPVAPRLVETLTVIAKELAMRTSPLAKVTAAAVPLGVVAQTSLALMFPAFRAK
jgi:hypothetical protein